MTEKAARALAATLDGNAAPQMPGCRGWGVILERTDGRFVAIEDSGGWAYRNRKALEAFQREGDESGIVASGEWASWDGSEGWAGSLASVLGTEAHQSGGNIWVVPYARWDGRFIVIGMDGAELYESTDHYKRYY
jgi:hypothetical protein